MYLSRAFLELISDMDLLLATRKDFLLGRGLVILTAPQARVNKGNLTVVHESPYVYK